MDTLESLIKDFDAGISERANWIERWDECYKLAMPGRTRFYDTAPGQSLTDEIFDSTADPQDKQHYLIRCFPLT